MPHGRTSSSTPRPTPAEDGIRAALTDDLDTGFTMLVDAYQGGIYSGAVRLTGSREDGQDVAQETFIRAYRALETWDATRIADASLRSWLWTIAINLCRNRAARRRHVVALHDGHDEGTTDPVPLDDAAWNRRLDELPAAQRTAVVLRHVVDLPIDDIAAITGRPNGTVKTDISRGLIRLRTVIEREDHA